MDLGIRLKERRLELGLTLEEVGNIVGVGKSTVAKWESGYIENMKRDKIALLSSALQESPLWVMGMENEIHNSFKTKKIPLLGTIAAGQPIYADEEHCTLLEVDADMQIDFCLKVKGDSMIDARILDGDIVFVRKQPDVENGEIAVVLIDDEATLKRVYKINDTVLLKAENSNYQPMLFNKEDYKDVRILGKAIIFQSKVY